MTQTNESFWLGLFKQVINISPIIKIEENWGTSLVIYFYRMDKSLLDEILFAISCFKDFGEQIWNWSDETEIQQDIQTYFVKNFVAQSNINIKNEIQIASLSRLNYYFDEKNTNVFSDTQLLNMIKYHEDNYFYFATFEDDNCYYALSRQLV